MEMGRIVQRYEILQGFYKGRTQHGHWAIKGPVNAYCYVLKHIQKSLLVVAK